MGGAAPAGRGLRAGRAREADHGHGPGRRAGERFLPGEHRRGLLADLLAVVQQAVGQVTQHGELAVGPDDPLGQQVRGLGRGGLRLRGLPGGQGGLVDQPQEPEQLVPVPQRQAEAGQDGLPRIPGDRHRLARGEHAVLGQPAAQPGAGAALQHRLHPAAVQPPGLRADGQRPQRGVVDDHRPVQVAGQPLGEVLQVLLEHTVVLPGGPAVTPTDVEAPRPGVRQPSQPRGAPAVAA